MMGVVLGFPGCAGNPADPVDVVLPGLQSQFTWIRTVTSDDPAAMPTLDTMTAIVAGYIDSYRGKSNVAQISIGGATTYVVFGPDRRLTTQERLSFPGTFVSEPIWITWPFDGEQQGGLLIDSLIGQESLPVRATWSAAPGGRREVVLRGERFTGYDISYTFTYELPAEERLRFVEGSATWLPELGWRSRIEERTTFVLAGDTVATSHRVDRLISWVRTPR